MSGGGNSTGRPVLIRGTAGFAAWRNSWERLRTRVAAQSPWHQAEWLEAAWSYPGAPMLLAVHAQGNDLQAGLALCRRWETGGVVRTPLRGLHCLPHLPYLYPTCTVAAAEAGFDRESGVRLVDTAFRGLSWDAALISRIDARSHWFEVALRALAERRGWRIRETECSAEAWLDFSDGPDAYWATRSGQMRRKLNAGERELLVHGELRFTDLAAESPSWEACWAALEDIYRRSWQKGAGLSPFDPPWNTANRAGLGAFHRLGQVRAFTLLVGGRPVAFDLWLGAEKSIYGLARGMDAEFRDGSAGGVLARWAIARSFELGYRRLSLGPVNDQPHFAYKRRWLTHTDPGRLLLVLRPRSWYGVLEGLLARHPRFAAAWERQRMSDRLRGLFDRARRWYRRAPTAAAPDH